MSKLSNMPNIGKVLEDKLMEIGIESSEELTKLGSKEAFIRIKMLDSTVCCNTLYALEGAIKGMRWHGLDDEEKKVLKEFFQSMK